MKEEDQTVRILLKLSGEVLAGEAGHGIDSQTIKRLTESLMDLVSDGIQVGIVTGGGNYVRGRDLQSIDRITGDQMGMIATVINSLALRDAIEKHGGNAVVLSAIQMLGFVEPFSSRLAIDFLECGYVVIYAGGTGNPCLTTDTAAALRAVQTGCSILLKGTKVDGIYDSDPEHNPDAKRFAKLSFEEVLKLDLKVMDAAAVAICRDAELPISVFDIREPANIVRILSEPSIGSIVGGNDSW
ncbi:MAG: UMP kinase [Candidatus Fermentibacteraceae bacterium]|nr:UMP kinase [Candidatus Fermentibacteraceae bacterium]